MDEQSLGEYRAVRDGGAGLIDLSSRGRLLVNGSEALMFLNGLLTNDMKTLAVNSWMAATFANVQGRLLAAVRVIHRSDGFLIDTENATHEVVMKLLERFTLAGDFRINDLSAETCCFSVQGKRACEVINLVVGSDFSNIGHQDAVSVPLNNRSVTVIRATHTSEDGFDLFVDASEGEQFRTALLQAGSRMVSADVAEALRVEAGIPRYGLDMDETNVVTETNLDDAVSFTKGCYIGQEIIVRIKHRGHVAKRITGVILREGVSINRDAKIFSLDDKEIGRVTSSALSPQLGRTVALAYIKYDYLKPGAVVKIESAGQTMSATTAELPFIRGSWYEQ